MSQGWPPGRPEASLRALLLALALALGAPAHAQGVPAAPPAVSSRSLLGDWQILGPVSSSTLVQMMTFSFQTLPPTASEMSAAGLSASLQERVNETRSQLAANPQQPDLVELRQTWEALRKTHMVITPKAVETHSPSGVDKVAYTLLRESSNQIFVRMDKPGAPPMEVIFTFTSPNLLLMGPMGQEPLVLQRGVPR